MPVYAIALINIHDRDTYGEYEQAFMPVFEQFSGRLLAVDEAPIIKEGTWDHTRTVLLEFPDQQAFDDWYQSDAYQHIVSHRFNASEGHVAVLQGLTS